MLRPGRRWPLFLPFEKRGCSSVVEHLLAKEDVASSSLVTRSSLRLERSGKRRLSAIASAKADLLWRSKLLLAGQPSKPMYYVYLLKSESHPSEQYVGLTRDLRRRLSYHNCGRSPHTAKFCPWFLIAYFAFAIEKRAITFEKYLKSGSGRAFAKGHFV
jgi:putative endonuclease